MLLGIVGEKLIIFLNSSLLQEKRIKCTQAVVDEIYTVAKEIVVNKSAVKFLFECFNEGDTNLRRAIFVPQDP